MMFAMVSASEAGCFSWFQCNATSSVQAANTPADASARDMDRPGNVLTGGSPYPCIASPAYVDYTDARAVPCSVKDTAQRAPNPMGSPGF
jgi:hypothetical protein